MFKLRPWDMLHQAFCRVHIADGSSLYHSFLRGEFSNENLEFWLAVEDYKHSTKPKDMAAKAQQIYKDFLTVQASKKQQV